MIQLNTFRCGGVVYKITDVEYVGKNKDFPKKSMWLEVPTTYGVNQKTELFGFEVVGDDVSSLDRFSEGSWLDVVFKIEGRTWKNPQGKEVLFTSLKIIDAKEGKNPFDEGKEIKSKPADLSNTVLSDTGDFVKDWANEVGTADVLKKKSIWDTDGPDEYKDLPF